MSVTDLSPAPLAAGRSAQAVVDDISNAAKSSFSLGMKLLSRPRREAMRATYAFCRVVDDIADGDLPEQQKRDLLGAWRVEIDRLYQGQPVSAIGQALEGPVQTYDLPKAEWLMMIEGMEMDANGPILAPTDQELCDYTRRVAGSVGILSMRIFGAWRGKVSCVFACALADALQLTNILRDVEEDAAIGRIYLPRALLDLHGVSADCGLISGDPGLPAVRRDLGARARRDYRMARAAIPAHSRASLAPALAMLGVYEGYLDRMEQQDWLLPDPLKMSRLEKILRGFGGVLLAGPSR